MSFWNSARNGGGGAMSRMTTILLCLTILMTSHGMAEQLVASPGDNTKTPLYIFTTDAEFNITTKLGVTAPKCARLCYPFPAELFVDKQVPCAEHEGDADKWVPCLCTHRPFIRYLVDCIFRKCGPAIESAFDFGYQICADYNVTFPPPPEAVADLNITVINEAITIPRTIPNMSLPFSKELPPAKDGGSTSDENPPLNLNLSMQSAAWQGKSCLFGVWGDGSQARIGLATIATWIAMTIALAGGFAGL